MVRNFEKGYLALGLFLGLLFFINLGSYGLLEDNEARFLEISWEMKESGDLVVPRLNYIVHFHKPPLTFWVESLSLKIFGDTESAARLPVTLAALATLFLTAGFVQDRSSRTLTLLVLACNVEFWLLSRTVLTDMYLALSVTVCLFCAWKLHRGPSRTAAAIFWTSAGLSSLIKGPVGLTIVALTLVSFHIWERRKNGNGIPRSNWQLSWGLPLFLAVTLPWYIAVCVRYPDLFRYLAEFQTVQRVATEVHGRGGPPWFYIPVILVGFLPWCFFLPAAMKEAFQRSDDLDRFLLCWLIAPLLLFSASGSKLPTYILPLFPALALLTARYLKEAKGRVNLVLGLFYLFMGVAVTAYWHHGLPPEIAPASNIVLMSGLVCGAFGLAGLLLTKTGQASLATRILAVGFGCFLMTLSFGFRAAEDSYSARQVARELQPVITSDTLVAELSDHLHGLPFYLKRRMIQIAYPRETQFDPPESVKPYLYDTFEHFMSEREEKDHILLIMRSSDYNPERFPDWTILHKGRWIALERSTSPKE